jgi:hypothetical protein
VANYGSNGAERVEMVEGLLQVSVIDDNW